MTKINIPKVSVCIVTFNQKEYIGQCLDSVIRQETNFEFEVIVSDDCSTDGTSDVIKEFAEKYPAVIRSIRHEKNIGALENFRFVHEQARGMYVAHVDGDDYALPGKLKNQVDFLDANPNCNIVYHPVKILENQQIKSNRDESIDFLSKKYYRKDLIELIVVGVHSSKMYRVKDDGFVFPDFNLVDYTTNVIHVGDGYAAYCTQEPLGVYRKGIGISGSSNVIESVYNTLLYFRRQYPDCSDEVYSSVLSWLFFSIKFKRDRVLLFLRLAIVDFSLRGLVRFFYKKIKRKLIKEN